MTEPADLLVLACLPQNYDAATHVCSAPFYTYPPTAIPTLSIADAQAIGLQIAIVFAVAWGFRMCKRAIEQIG